jgi:hypothetical protein
MGLKNSIFEELQVFESSAKKVTEATGGIKNASGTKSFMEGSSHFNWDYRVTLFN